MRSSSRGAFKLKHGTNQPANRWYQQGVRAAVAWVHLCCPYGGRQGGILIHPLEQGLLITDVQPRAKFYARSSLVLTELKPGSKELRV
jgi:hypothetical protein